MLNDQITLSLYQEAQAPPGTPPADPGLPALEDTIVVGPGGFGGDTALRTLALCALGGSAPVVGTLDNAASRRAAPVLPNGRAVADLLPANSHLYLDTGDRRTALLDYPLLAARYRRLLRGVWVAHTAPQAQGGHGGGALPLMTLIDLDLQMTAVRTWLRQLLQQATGPRTSVGGVLAGQMARQAQARRAPFVLVVAGGSGSCGAGASLLLGYLLRQEAQRLNLARPIVWLLLGGPRAFQGLTRRTLINYGATLQALRHLARLGIDRPGIDGETLREQAQPYDRVWLVDDPLLPADGTVVTPREQEAFSWRVAAAARALAQPAVRAAYLDHVANAVEHDTEVDWPGFGTLQIGQGGLLPELLEPYLAAALAERRAAELADRLAGSEPSRSAEEVR